MPYDESHPLMLVTPHSRFRINSTGSNISWVRERDPVRLWINPSDADDRGISTGDMVRVQNTTGLMKVAALLTDDVMRGVVSCDQGEWFGSDGDGSVNRLTPLDPTLPSMGTRTHTVFVGVSREGHA